jgi:hypothetical protein
MPISPTDAVVREACGSHFPGGFANNLWRCTEYSMKHIAITDASDPHQTVMTVTATFEFFIPNNSYNIIARRALELFSTKLSGITTQGTSYAASAP